MIVLTCFFVLFCISDVRMREEYNSILSTPAEADKIGCFGRYRCIGKTQILTQYIGQADISVYLYLFVWFVCTTKNLCVQLKSKGNFVSLN